MSKTLWVIFAFFAIVIGVYPMMYLLLDMSGGLLNSKSEELLQSSWKVAFMLHIIPGGLALLVGWPQFSSKIRTRHISLHRVLGKIYILSVAVSGFSGLYISFEATGGIFAKLGFACLALAWLFTSFMAWKAIVKRDINDHQHWMIRSFALCFAAVTLRIWLPIFTIAGIPFLTAYVIIAWLCWVPNSLFAEFLVWKLKRRAVPAS